MCIVTVWDITNVKRSYFYHTFLSSIVNEADNWLFNLGSPARQLDSAIVQAAGYYQRPYLLSFYLWFSLLKMKWNMHPFFNDFFYDIGLLDMIRTKCFQWNNDVIRQSNFYCVYPFIIAKLVISFIGEDYNVLLQTILIFCFIIEAVTREICSAFIQFKIMQPK